MFQGIGITVPISKNLLLNKKEVISFQGAASNYFFKEVKLFKLPSDILTLKARNSAWNKTKIQAQSTNSIIASFSCKCYRGTKAYSFTKKKGNRNIHHMEINHTAGQFQTLQSFRNYSVVVYIKGSFIFYVQNEPLRAGIHTRILMID